MPQRYADEEIFGKATNRYTDEEIFGNNLPRTQNLNAGIMESMGMRDFISNSMRALAHGYLTRTADLPQGAAIAASEVKRLGGVVDPADSSQLYQFGEAVQKFADTAFPEDPRIAHPAVHYVATALPRGLGQIGAFIGPGAAAKLLKAPAMLGTLTASTASGAAEMYKDAKAEGAGEEEAQDAALFGAAVIGGVNAVPVGRLFSRWNKATSGRLKTSVLTHFKNGAYGSFEEGLQEYVETAAGNAYAKEFYDADREYLEGAREAGEVGAGVGFVANLIASGAGARIGRGRRRRAEAVAAQIRSNPETEQKLLDVALQKAAQNKTPSRKDFMRLGILPGGERYRADVVAALTETAGVPTETAESEGSLPRELEEDYEAPAAAEEATPTARAPTDPPLEITPLADLEEMATRYGLPLPESPIEDVRRAELLERIRDLDRHHRWAIPASDPEVRQVIRKLDKAYELTSHAQPIKIEPVFEQAKALLAEDFDGQVNRLIQVALVDNEQFGPEDTALAGTALDSDRVKELFRLPPTERKQAVKLGFAYRMRGTDWGRIGRLRHDILKKPIQERRKDVIQDALLTPPTKLLRKMQKAVKDGDTKKLDELAEDWARKLNELKRKLAERGFDPSDLGRIANDENAAANVLRQIAAFKRDLWDAAYEYWQQAILSGPHTQIANALGNTLNIGWHFTGQKLVASVLGSAARRPGAPQISDMAAMLRWSALKPAIAKASRNMMRTWTTENSAFETDMGLEGAARIEVPDQKRAVLGKKYPAWGRFVRAFGWRPLLAADDLFQTFAANIQVIEEARKYARLLAKTNPEMGLSDPKVMAQFVRDQINDHTSLPWQRALDTSQELVFKKRSKALRGLSHLRRQFPVADKILPFMVPFVVTPGNIFVQGFRKSPFGMVPLLKRTWRAFIDRDWSQLPDANRVAEQMWAWAPIWFLWAHNDAEDPWLTGAAGEANYQKRLTAERTGIPPQSIKLDGKWYSYARLEPFATALSLMVDEIDAIKYGDAVQIPAKTYEAILGQVHNKTFMQGLSDFVELIQRRDVDDAKRWASRFSASWVPNVFKHLARNLKPEDYKHLRSVWGDPEAGWTNEHGWFMRGIQHTEMVEPLGLDDIWPALQATARHNLWGDRISYHQPQTALPFKLLFPSRTMEPGPLFVGDELIWNWNWRNYNNPEAQWYPTDPQKYFRIKGEKRIMNNAEYEEFTRLAGQTLKKLVAAQNFNAEDPTEQDIDMMKSLIRQSRDEVKEALINKWDHGATKRLNPQSISTKLISEQKVSLTKAISRDFRKEGKLDPDRRLAALEAFGQLRRIGVNRQAAMRLLRQEYKSPRTRRDRIRRLMRRWQQWEPEI